MDLSFQEKSAWGLLLGIVIVSFFYFPAAFEIVAETPHGGALIGISIAGIIALIVIEGIYHALIATSSGEETDERDRLIGLRAERNSGYVLGICLFWLVGHIIVNSTVLPSAVPNALEIAVYILLAITVSEVSKLLWQIWYYRTGS